MRDTRATTATATLGEQLLLLAAGPIALTALIILTDLLLLSRP
ncbi:MAG: hypothetical protein ACTS10_04375 [Kiloniellales bacterium]